MIEPAKRSYDDATRARLVELFGEPERWAATTQQLPVGGDRRARAGVHRRHRLPDPMQCTFDLELAAAKYLYSLPDGKVPLTFNFTGTIFYRGDDGPDADREGAVGRRRALRDAGLDLARDDATTTTRTGGWVRLDDGHARRARPRARPGEGCRRSTPPSPRCWRGR